MTNSHTELIQQKSQTLINSKISVMKKLIFFTLLSGFMLQSEAQTLQLIGQLLKEQISPMMILYKLLRRARMVIL
jgi:hypothetical protein